MKNLIFTENVLKNDGETAATMPSDKSLSKLPDNKTMRIAVCFLTVIISNFSFACGSTAEIHQMSDALYKDLEMRTFVCGAGVCSADDFLRKIKFEKHFEIYKGNRINICLVEPVLTARNSYTGIFAKTVGSFDFQFISYGTGISVTESGGGVPILTEGGYYDQSSNNYEKNIYMWDGRRFIFKKIHNVNSIFL